MAKQKSFVQKYLFEIRFEPRPSMFSLGGKLSDLWVEDFPEIEVNLPNYRLNDKKNYRFVLFGFNSAFVEVEGVNDIGPFVKLCQRLAKDVIDIVEPKKIARLGLRQVSLMSGPSRQGIIQYALGKFANQEVLASMRAGRDEVSDIGIVIDYKPKDSSFQGRVQFGPYVQGINNVQNLTHADHPSVRESGTKDTFIFDCDYAQTNADLSVLSAENLERWILNASQVSRERSAVLRRFFGGTALTGE